MRQIEDTLERILQINEDDYIEMSEKVYDYANENDLDFKDEYEFYSSLIFFARQFQFLHTKKLSHLAQI